VTGPASRMLDWKAFAAGYFPGRGKHDLEALVAYGAYRRGEGSPAAKNVTVAERDEDALEVWEGEGGMVSLAYGR
jgi:hypothetical protein